MTPEQLQRSLDTILELAADNEIKIGKLQESIAAQTANINTLFEIVKRHQATLEEHQETHEEFRKRFEAEREEFWKRFEAERQEFREFLKRFDAFLSGRTSRDGGAQ